MLRPKNIGVQARLYISLGLHPHKRSLTNNRRLSARQCVLCYVLGRDFRDLRTPRTSATVRLSNEFQTRHPLVRELTLTGRISRGFYHEKLHNHHDYQPLPRYADRRSSKGLRTILI